MVPKTKQLGSSCHRLPVWIRTAPGMKEDHPKLLAESHSIEEEEKTEHPGSGFQIQGGISQGRGPGVGEEREAGAGP